MCVASQFESFIMEKVAEKHEGDSHVVATVRELREKNAVTQFAFPFPQTFLEALTEGIHRHT